MSNISIFIYNKSIILRKYSKGNGTREVPTDPYGPYLRITVITTPTLSTLFLTSLLTTTLFFFWPTRLLFSPPLPSPSSSTKPITCRQIHTHTHRHCFIQKSFNWTLLFVRFPDTPQPPVPYENATTSGPQFAVVHGGSAAAERRQHGGTSDVLGNRTDEVQERQDLHHGLRRRRRRTDGEHQGLPGGHL